MFSHRTQISQIADLTVPRSGVLEIPSAAAPIILALFFLVWAGGAGAQTTKPEMIIGQCGCAEACFTDDVTNVECTDRDIRFESRGLPDPSHVMMRGITATNQQYPREHAYEITLPMRPRLAPKPTATEPGPIGIAVNGVPLFDPGTQGRIDHGTGKAPHTLDKGELDECGGHAGRGDDYHYHIAPKCLIAELGKTHVEEQKKPIGFAKDGFPILALGWFEKANDIEASLDECRGARDSTGAYFYNVKATAKWDILSCYAGELRRISRDRWEARRDLSGAEIVGAKARMSIANYRMQKFDGAVCHIIEGELVNQRVLKSADTIDSVSSPAAIFYCNPLCYAEFFEPEPRREFRGPVIFYERITEACPARFQPESLPLLDAYDGPKLEKKRARLGKKKKRRK